jgi:hypothetical protein
MTPTRLLSPISAPLGQNGDEIAPLFEIIAIIEVPLTETRGSPECRAETSHPPNNSTDYCGLHDEGGGSASKKKQRRITSCDLLLALLFFEPELRGSLNAHTHAIYFVANEWKFPEPSPRAYDSRNKLQASVKYARAQTQPMFCQNELYALWHTSN